MLRTDAEALRDEAARKVRERIEADRRRASRKVAPIVAYIGEHLFEPGLSYDRMRRDCRIRDNNRSTVFRQEIGLTPAAYMRDLRFEVACRLLRDTELGIGTIGPLVGYDGPSVFVAAFRRWAGLTPARYRRQERRIAKDAVSLPQDRPDLSPATWRRFVEGDLAGEEADLLLRYLLDRYPASRRRLVCELLRRIQIEDRPGEAREASSLTPSLRSLFAREDIEVLMAEAVWESIREKPYSEVEDLVRHHLWFSTPAFFELLGEKSRTEGREDRERGISIARLAIVAAEHIEGTGTDDGGEGRLKALAWGWLGNAKRLALDFTGADAAFRAAQQRLPRGADREAGIILSMLASLRSWQHRYEEALEASNAAVPKLRSARDTITLARTYLLRGIVQWQRGQLQEAVRDNELAAQLLDETRGAVEPHLYLAVRLNLASYLVDLGAETAGAAVANLREFFKPSNPSYGRVLWLEGMYAASQSQWEIARERLQEAEKVLERHDDMTAVAVLRIDLALVSLRAGNVNTARELVEGAIPIFAAMAVSPEALVGQVFRDDATEVRERLAEMLVGGLTTRGLRTLRRFAQRLPFGG